MICAVIPTYNNARTLRDVILRTMRHIRDIIVVVDGSTDDTLQVLSSLDDPVTVVALDRNYGKGYALRQGFRKALEMGFTHALTIDSDGQHFPEDIPSLLAISRQQPETFVVGNRNIEADNMPRRNTFANRFSNFWFAVQTGVRLPDTQTGLRVYPLDRLHGLGLMTSRYEAELELLVFAAWAGEKIVSVPVRVYYPPKNERVSHFRPVYDFARISLLNTVLCLVALVYGLPRRWWRSAFYAPWFLFCWMVGLIVTLFCLLFRVRTTTYRLLFHYGASILMHTFPASPFRVRREQGSLDDGTSTVYIANHTSLFDILAIVAIHPNLIILTQNWVFSNPFFAATARMAGFVSVAHGFDVIVPVIQSEAVKGASVLVFPEGGRSDNGVLRRFHTGAFELADRLNMPVQPVLIQGMFRMMSKGEVFVGKTRMTATLLPAILPNDAQWGMSVRERTKKAHKYYERLLTAY